MREANATSKRNRTIRVLLCVVPVVACLIALGACTSAKPNDATSSGSPGGGGGAGDTCATPNEGCACAEPGEVVPCGEVKRTTPDGYTECMIGNRTCAGLAWGACVGERDVIRDPNATSTVGSRSTIGPGLPCGDGGGPANDCDPYCNGIVDNPGLIGLSCDGGGPVGVVDGGLALCPTTASEAGTTSAANGIGGAPPTVQTTATGDSTCGGNGNLHGGACTLANQFRACQQDFRCDPTTLTCQWNGPNNYYDNTAGGADLTIGTGCNDGTSDHLPVCNRGSTSVASGALVTVNIVNPAQYTSWNTGACPALAGPPTCQKMLTTPLDPGQCVDITGCTLNGDNIAIVNSEAGAIAEAAGRCANNAAKAKTDSAPGCAACTLCDTKLEGTVYDPSGPGGNNIPLAGVSVFVPAQTPPTFTDGVQCDNCASIEGPYMVKSVTDYKGNFTIEGVPPGTKVPIVVQSGRWRRVIQQAITACADNKDPAVPAGTFRMPTSHTDGLGGQADIPKTAIVTASQESLECLFVKMGVASGEITSPTAPTPGRIHMFKDKGMSPPTASPAPETLWSSQAAIDAYTAALFPCSASRETMQGITAAQSRYLALNASKGGHLLWNHHAADKVFSGANSDMTLASSGTFVSSGAASNYKFLAENASAPQQQFYNWLNNVGGMATNGAPLVTTTDGVKQVTAAGAGSTVWLGGQTSSNWNAGFTNQDFVASYSFEMGVTAGNPAIAAECGAPLGHGRVFFNGMHVSPTRGNSGGTFPMACNLGAPLNETEKALEFHLFELTACALGGSPPPVPPTLTSFTITRDFVATCDPGFRVKWAPFYWQDILPGNSEIAFRAATADTQADLDLLPSETTAPGAPVTADIGTAIATVIPPAWGCNGCPTTPVTVDSELKTDTGKSSDSYLRIYMNFIPDTPTHLLSPILLAWRQTYDCVPSE